MPTHAIIIDNEPTTVAVYKRTTILDNDAIKALPTTPVEIFPSPGAGKAYIFLGGFLNWDFVQGYTNIGAICVLFPGEFGVIPTEIIANNWNSPSVASKLILADPQSIVYSPDDADVTTGAADAYSAKSYLSPGQGFDGSPVTMRIDNYDAGYSVDQGNFTGGHIDNILKITFLYSTIDL